MSEDGDTQPCFADTSFSFSTPPLAFIYSCLTHHCNGVTGQDGAHVQDGVVGHIGEDVDGGDDGHGDGDGQGKVSEMAFEARLGRIQNQAPRLCCLRGERKVQITKGQHTVPLRVFDLLRDKVERVPAGVGEECGVECQGDVAGIGARSMEGRLKVVSVTWGGKNSISEFKRSGSIKSWYENIKEHCVFVAQEA